MKKHIFFILFVLFSFSAFAHKAQKQTEKLIPEVLTQKWLECEAAGEEDAPGQTHFKYFKNKYLTKYSI